MTKDQLLQELLDHGISIFDEEDSRETMIEALYLDDEFQDEYPDSYQRPLKNSEW